VEIKGWLEKVRGGGKFSGCCGSWRGMEGTYTHFTSPSEAMQGPRNKAEPMPLSHTPLALDILSVILSCGALV
jgi:hypothetical protein